MQKAGLEGMQGMQEAMQQAMNMAMPKGKDKKP